MFNPISIPEINYIRLAVFIGGIVLFLMSYSLVKNAIFYYTSGCTIGVLASLLIVGFVVYRLTPRVCFNWFIGNLRLLVFKGDPLTSILLWLLSFCWTNYFEYNSNVIVKIKLFFKWVVCIKKPRVVKLVGNTSSDSTDFLMNYLHAS